MAYGYLGEGFRLSNSSGGSIEITIESAQTTASGYQTVYTFTPPEDSGFSVIFAINSFNVTTHAKLSVIEARGGFYRTGAAAPALVGGGSGLTMSQRDNFSPNVQVRLLVSGNDVLLQVNPGTANTVDYTYELKIISFNA